MIILIKDALYGRNFPDAGDYVYNMMLPGADTDDACIWDMQDVSELPSMFLNMSLGRFIKDRGVAFVKQKVRFRNINKSQALRIVEYVEKISK
jgi:hypothetical protein